MILPAFGIISEIIPTFARKPLFGYASMVYATASIAILSFTVWAHHMFHHRHAGGGATVLHVRDDADRGPHRGEGLQLGRHHVARLDDLRDPDAVGDRFHLRIHHRWLHGADLRDRADRHPAQDTYYVVAHFHYVLVAGSLFALFAGPTTGCRNGPDMADERLGKIHFWCSMVFFNITFFPMHFLGLAGMPRRIPDYALQFADFNALATIGAFGSACRS